MKFFLLRWWGAGQTKKGRDAFSEMHIPGGLLVILMHLIGLFYPIFFSRTPLHLSTIGHECTF